MRRWWQIWCAREALNPSQERTSGKSKRRSEIHIGVERRVARREGDSRGEEVRHKEGEELLKTFWLATSKRRL